MAFKKTIKTGEVLKETRSNTEFPKGTKFVMDHKIHRVIEEFTDSSTDWRRTMSDTGDEELVMLSSLKRDLDAGALKFIEATKQE